MPKLKTNKSVAKRIRKTKSGKFMTETEAKAAGYKESQKD